MAQNDTAWRPVATHTPPKPMKHTEIKYFLSAIGEDHLYVEALKNVHDERFATEVVRLLEQKAREVREGMCSGH